MKVSDLICWLQSIENFDLPVGYVVQGEFKALDETIGVLAYPNLVELQHEVVIPKDEEVK